MCFGANPEVLWCRAGGQLCVGSRVVRGPDWDQGQRDLGAGNIGRVLRHTSFEGAEGKGVEVCSVQRSI